MHIDTITLHNYRSIKDATINLASYSLLVGENNSGKTGLITALRAFYEDGGMKFDSKIDFPKFKTDDNESWLEIHYNTTDAEQESLKKEYRAPDKILRVRRYFKSDNPDLVKSGQSNIFAFEKGVLSKSLFYGAKNISQAKLGTVIFIPEVSKTEDTLKLSGPSPFRDMLNFVMKRAVLQSKTFDVLQKAFNNFNSEFGKESTNEGFSINSLIDEINKEIENWRIKFGVDVNPIKPEDIIKNLLSHYIEDQNLDGQRVNISSYGQGLQRHLIYTFIRLSAKFTDKSFEKKKDFSPDFTFILFEEPEAFLHPSQQDRLNTSLRTLGDEDGQQVLITTHSPYFVCRNILKLPSIIRLNKNEKITTVFQLTKDKTQKLLDKNFGLYKLFSDLLNDPITSSELKAKIQNSALGEDDPDQEKKLEEEAIRFLLLLDAEKASIVFSKHVVICEGSSEKILFDYLIDQKWNDLKNSHVYFVDTLGKYNIHRYIALLSDFGINHSILMDKDKDTDIHRIINDFIDKCSTSYTKSRVCFDNDFEEFLGIPRVKRRDLKPLQVMRCFFNGEISDEKLKEIRGILETLICM